MLTALTAVTDGDTSCGHKSVHFAGPDRSVHC